MNQPLIADPLPGSSMLDNPNMVKLDADALLELVRPLVAVVDGLGMLFDVRGGAGGFFGHRAADLVGRNVLELVPPSEHAELAHYFVELASVPVTTAQHPIPFRSAVLGVDGREHPVDVIPTAIPSDIGVNGWAIVLVPLALEASASRSLDAELAGTSRSIVKRLLTEELELVGAEWSAHWFLVDLGPGETVSVATSRSGDAGFTEPLRAVFADGWSPWTSWSADQLIEPDATPEPLRSAIMSGGWDIVSAAPIRCDGSVVAALVRIGRSLGGDPSVAIRTNVVSRIRGLVEVTTLLYGRWRERDRLVTAATTDALTGLANREAFATALGERGGRAAVVYVDIDRFKDVNDVYGHGVGDQVLATVARRLVAVSRPTDVVVRLGGDEFSIVLGAVDRDTARRIGQRVLDAVREPLQIAGGPPHVTVSVGVALPSPGVDVVEMADRAMLAAKRRGRSRLVVV